MLRSSNSPSSRPKSAKASFLMLRFQKKEPRCSSKMYSVKGALSGGYKNWQAHTFHVPSKWQANWCLVYLNSESPGGMAWTFYAWLWKPEEDYWLWFPWHQKHKSMRLGCGEESHLTGSFWSTPWKLLDPFTEVELEEKFFSEAKVQQFKKSRALHLSLLLKWKCWSMYWLELSKMKVAFRWNICNRARKW